MGTGEVVAKGHFSSSDPNACVHHIPIGPSALRVWVDVPMKRDRVFLWRPTSDMTYIDDAVGSTVAWPTDSYSRLFTRKELKKVEQDTPESSSTNLKEDVLSKVLGLERGGRVRTFGKGVVLSKLAIISQANSRTAQLEEGQIALKAQVARMQNVISELQKNQNHATKEGSSTQRLTTPIISPAVDWLKRRSIFVTFCSRWRL